MTTPELISYVSTALKSGAAREAIEAALKTQGWTPADMAEAFAKVGAVGTPPPDLMPKPDVSPKPALSPKPFVPVQLPQQSKPPINLIQKQPVQQPIQQPVQQPIQKPIQKPAQQPVQPVQPVQAKPAWQMRPEGNVLSAQAFQGPGSFTAAAAPAPTMPSSSVPGQPSSPSNPLPPPVIGAQFKPTPPTMSTAAPTADLGRPKKKSHLVGMILTVIIILVLGAGGTYAYFKYFAPPKLPAASTVIQQSMDAISASNIKFAVFNASSTIAASMNASSSGSTSLDLKLSSSGQIDSSAKPSIISSDGALTAHIVQASTTIDLNFSESLVADNKKLFFNIKGFNVSASSIDPKEQPQMIALSAMANGFVSGLENKWLSIDSSSVAASPAASSSVALPTGLVSAGDIELLKSYVTNLSFVSSSQNIGTESVRNVKAYHIKAVLKDDGTLVTMIRNIGSRQMKTASAAAKADFNKQMTAISNFLNNEADIDAWIGVTDHLIYRVAMAPIHLSDPGKSDATISFDISISDYNKPITIEMPQQSTPLEQVISGLMGGMSNTKAPVATTTKKKK